MNFFQEDEILELHTDAEMQEIFNFIIERAEQQVALPTPLVSEPEWTAKKLLPVTLHDKPLRHQMNWIGTPVDPRSEVSNYGLSGNVHELMKLPEYETKKSFHKVPRECPAEFSFPKKYRHRGRGSKKRNQAKHRLVRHTPTSN